MTEGTDLNLAFPVTYDERDVQCGREFPLFGEQMGNLTARAAHLFYTVKRRGDPMIHVPGSASSRTACGWSVVHAVDEVDVVDGRFPTCVRCMTAAFEQAAEAAARRAEATTYGRTIADSFLRTLTTARRK